MPDLVQDALEGFVVTAAFAGNTPVFALGDGTVRFGSGAAQRAVSVHKGAILVARPDGAGAILTAGDDGRVCRVTPDGAVTEIAARPRKWIDRLAVGPGGAIAFASGRTAWVRFPDGKEKTFEHARAIGGVAFAPKGMRLAASRYDGVTLWWPSAEGAPQDLVWKGMHLDVTFSPDGRYVVTTMQENALHGWRLADGKHMRMTGYPSKVRMVSWSAKGRYLATAGAQAAVVWPFHFKDGPMGRAPLELGFRSGLVTAVACHPTDEVAVIGYSDGAVLASRFADDARVSLREPDGAAISALSWDASGARIAFGTETGPAGVIDISE
ncbi:WD40 repeat domain-containing protein [Segnochrobactrum spirostomi]|uniref:WD40 repeat domain-containing protein n=1 Tax=Segnochrobactrum spirostomi TaxID=2608987 RepID=A0A6A7Y2N0_9HYPH|nr:WD40 repeat domain-containing protein [Segnochrobactrum spirostomi]MQT13344.1 WD40 repeat domain-containing protein [Segnochrobactrum spirostomi]